MQTYCKNVMLNVFKVIKSAVPNKLSWNFIKLINLIDSRRSWRFMDAYRKGLTGTAALYAVKKYKSHRRIPENVISF